MTAAFCVGNVSLHTPHPYESSLAFARIAFAGDFFAVFFFAGAFFAGFSALAFASRFGASSPYNSRSRALWPFDGFGSAFGFSVPWTLQNRQPCRT